MASGHPAEGRKETLTLGGGCFWCMEAVFKDLKGVDQVVSGYSGGRVPNPSYEQVCTGRTGHAEVVQVTFDPSVVSLRDLLHVFFTLHDPTTRDRQGDDVGHQYRSIILYRDEGQREAAREVVGEINASGVWGRDAVTEIVPFQSFYRAEEYHQDYYSNNQFQPYCQMVIRPKVEKLRRVYLSMLKKGD